MVAELVVKKNWSFAVYKIGEKFVLSVVCGGVAQYDLNIPISRSDAEHGLLDVSYLEKMANDIRSNPLKYVQRSIGNISSNDA